MTQSQQNLLVYVEYRNYNHFKTKIQYINPYLCYYQYYGNITFERVRRQNSVFGY